MNKKLMQFIKLYEECINKKGLQKITSVVFL